MAWGWSPAGANSPDAWKVPSRLTVVTMSIVGTAADKEFRRPPAPIAPAGSGQPGRDGLRAVVTEHDRSRQHRDHQAGALGPGLQEVPGTDRDDDRVTDRE